MLARVEDARSSAQSIHPSVVGLTAPGILSGAVQRSRRVVLAEEITAGGGSAETSLDRALLHSEARNDNRIMQLAAYTHQAVSETEHRVDDRLQASLRAAQNQIMENTAAQCEQRAVHLQAQLQYNLDSARAAILHSADTAMLDRASTMEAAIAAGLEKSEAAAFEYTNQVSIGIEQRMQQALREAQERIEENVAVREQQNNIQLEMKLERLHSTEAQKTREELKGVLSDHARSEIQERLSAISKSQIKSVDDLLQKKIDRAVKLSQVGIRDFVDKSMTEAQTSLSAEMHQMESKLASSLASQIGGMESRMQKMMLESRKKSIPGAAELKDRLSESHRQLQRQNQALEVRIALLEDQMKQASDQHTSRENQPDSSDENSTVACTRAPNRFLSRNKLLKVKANELGHAVASSTTSKAPGPLYKDSNRQSKLMAVASAETDMKKLSVLDAARNAARQVVSQRASARAATLRKNARGRQQARSKKN